ncbi:hypothetical protein QYE76_019686 [Lolium multiflorum]|uniref:Uncharacterized protein n=1 Tax=Lolium multiflorum TaxID=4521 RepID=A0AAD8R674_LOLMU|nr:hypothetical protein QYE76_019681 [Lolium multiflorum]KAK1614169.1 hypothetical protein QYE76_019686 [Lolium multiflorum]
MDGLIPFIYKTMKEQKTRRYSRCSSTGLACGFNNGGMEDDEVWELKQWSGEKEKVERLVNERWHTVECFGETDRESTGWMDHGRSSLATGHQSDLHSILASLASVEDGTPWSALARQIGRERETTNTCE